MENNELVEQNEHVLSYPSEMKTTDGAVSSAFATILVIELADLMAYDERYASITPAEWLIVVGHLQDCAGRELPENIADAMKLIQDARKEGNK